MQEYWQNIYSNFDPVAITLGPVPVHWYGIMYALALISAIFIAKWFIKHDELIFEIEENEVEKITKDLEKIMENIFTLNVPLKVSCTVGNSWQDLK